jgi:hypothetical protein
MISVGDRLGSERHEMADFMAVQEEFWARGWTDGLPVVPPTPELVDSFLETAGLEPHQVVGVLPERSREFTAEKVAINAVMAGCLVDYFPVVLAAWQAMCAPEFVLNATAMSTSGSAPIVIVNGPVVKQIGMRTGANLFGPGNRANATIGRAVRLCLINLAGAAGALDRATLGHPGRYSYCIAEDEDDKWEPLHVVRGFGREQSTVTVASVDAPQFVRESTAVTPEALLANYADHLKRWNQPGPGVVVINPDHRTVLQGAGWSKANVASFLHTAATRSVADLKRASRVPGATVAVDEETLVRMTSRPEDLMVIGAGGVGVFSAVISPGGAKSEAVTMLVPEPGCAGECFI